MTNETLTQTNSAADETSSDSLKIFIVEDDQEQVTALSVFLNERFGNSLSISIFSTGEAAVKQIDEATRIIILDHFLNMLKRNDANGIEIMEHIKQRYPKIHVIMLSGEEQSGLAMQIIEHGATQIILKDDTAFEQVAAIIDGFIWTTDPKQVFQIQWMPSMCEWCNSFTAKCNIQA